MTKQERVWKLNEDLGEEKATAKQLLDDYDKAAEYEQFFAQQVLGHKSNYKPE